MSPGIGRVGRQIVWMAGGGALLPAYKESPGDVTRACLRLATGAGAGLPPVMQATKQQKLNSLVQCAGKAGTGN